MAIFVIFVMFLFVSITANRAELIDSKEPLTTLEYNGENLPLWENNGTYHIPPIPMMNFSSVELLQMSDAVDKRIKSFLKFHLNFTTKNIKLLALNRIRNETGKCVQIDDLAMIPLELKMNVTVASLHFRKIVPFYLNETDFDKTIQMECLVQGFCAFIRTVIDLSRDITIQFELGGSAFKKFIKKVPSQEEVKAVNCEMSNLRYTIRKMDEQMQEMKSTFEKKILEIKKENAVSKNNTQKDISNIKVSLNTFKSRIFCYFAVEKQNSFFGNKCKPPNIDIRLVGSSKQGYLQARFTLAGKTTEWGGVCDDSFGPNTAKVVCRQLYSVSRGTYKSYDTGVVDFVLDNVVCSGSETNIGQCNHPGWGNEDCESHEHVWVNCN